MDEVLWVKIGRVIDLSWDLSAQGVSRLVVLDLAITQGLQEIRVEESLRCQEE